VLANGFGDLSREWLSLGQEQTRRNLDGLNNLLRSRSPRDLVAAQSDLTRQSLEDLLNRSARIADISVKMAGEAVQRLTSQAEETGRDARRTTELPR
jgi:hypothetical protein